jgi:hypothetical protein
MRRAATFLNVLACFSLLLTPLSALHAHVDAADVLVHGGHAHGLSSHGGHSHIDSQAYAGEAGDSSGNSSDSAALHTDAYFHVAFDHAIASEHDLNHTLVVELDTDTACTKHKYSADCIALLGAQLPIEPIGAMRIRLSDFDRIAFIADRVHLYPPLRGPPAAIL